MKQQLAIETIHHRNYEKKGSFRLICISDLQIKIMNHLHRQHVDNIGHMTRLFKRDRICVWQSLKALEHHGFVTSMKEDPKVTRSKLTYRMSVNGKKAYPMICGLEKLFKN